MLKYWKQYFYKVKKANKISALLQPPQYASIDIDILLSCGNFCVFRCDAKAAPHFENIFCNDYENRKFSPNSGEAGKREEDEET